MDRSEPAAAIHATSHLVGAFLLRSGRTASEYVDKYRFEPDPILLRAIAEQAAGHIPAGTEVLAGSELGGVPVATALSLESGLPVVFVRKAAKPYGTRRLAEGAGVDGRRVGRRPAGARCPGRRCALRRRPGEGGAENLTTHGLTMRAPFTAGELKAAASQRADDVRDLSRSRTPTTR